MHKIIFWMFKLYCWLTMFTVENHGSSWCSFCSEFSFIPGTFGLFYIVWWSNGIKSTQIKENNKYGNIPTAFSHHVYSYIFLNKILNISQTVVLNLEYSLLFNSWLKSFRILKLYNTLNRSLSLKHFYNIYFLLKHKRTLYVNTL